MKIPNWIKAAILGLTLAALAPAWAIVKNATSGGGSSGAPSDATYITQTANGSLSAEQALGALGTGILKSTTSTGVVSIAGSSDVIGTFSGACATSSCYLAADGSRQTLSSGVTLYQAFKTSSTSRTTGTLSNDPHLVISNIPAGTYSFDAYFVIIATSSSGFASAHVSNAGPTGNVSSFAISETTGTPVASGASVQFTTTAGAPTSAYTGQTLTDVRLSGVLTCSSTCNYALSWAQANVAGSTTLNTGSWVRFTPLQ